MRTGIKCGLFAIIQGTENNMKEKLVKEGAIAVKPTGGGLGGAMLGLFE